MQAAFTGSGNEGVQIGQNPGTVYVISEGATVHTGPLGCHSYFIIFSQFQISIVIICVEIISKLKVYASA
jgi:hypothetical protein